MTSSGTVGQTTIDVATLIEHAMRRAGNTPSEATADTLKAARENLYFYLCSLSNAGVNLWTIEKELIGINVGQSNYAVGVGTRDIKNALRRTLGLPSGGTAASSAGGNAANAFDQNATTACTQTSINGNISYQFPTTKFITTVGIMTNGDQTYNLVWEASSDGITWSQVLATGKTNYTGSQWKHYDISTPLSAAYFRVRETANGTLNVLHLIFGTVIQEIPISRINFDTYSNLTDKTFQANNSLQYWFDRKAINPEMRLWPTPDYAFYQIVVWRTRNIQDVGSMINTLELPDRWADAAMKELASRLHLELPEMDKDRYGILKEEAEKATFNAQQEERDNSPIYVLPNIGVYTR